MHSAMRQEDSAKFLREFRRLRRGLESLKLLTRGGASAGGGHGGWTTTSSSNLFESKSRFPYRGSGFCVVAAESRCKRCIRFPILYLQSKPRDWAWNGERRLKRSHYFNEDEGSMLAPLMCQTAEPALTEPATCCTFVHAELLDQ